MIKNKLAILILASFSIFGCMVANATQTTSNELASQTNQSEMDFKQTLALAKQGDADAQFRLAEMYENGIGVDINIEEAIKWVTKSAYQGNDKAELSFGAMYLHGVGVADKTDYVQAAKWLTKSANQNNADAQFNLGVLYENGLGVEQDYVQAKQFYEKASDQNHPMAQLNLGVLYETGRGVKQDYTQAMQWFKKSAAQNFGFAQAKIAMFYNTGKGVEQDKKTGMAWHEKACANGFALSCQALPLSLPEPEEIKSEIIKLSCDNGVKTQEIKTLVVTDKNFNLKQLIRNTEQVMNLDDYYEGNSWKCHAK